MKKQKLTPSMILKLVYSYMQNTINPMKAIPLDYLKTLLPEDLDCVDETMFEEVKYSKEDVQRLLKLLNKVIYKLEKEEGVI